MKYLCDKVSKFKNLRWQFRRIFRWLCHSVLHFFCRLNFHGEIYRTKWPLFDVFGKTEKNLTLRRKISVIKFQKSKIWDDSFVGISTGFLMVYFVFSVGSIFMAKFTEQNGLFLTLLENMEFSWRNLQNKMASFRVNICCNIEIFLIKESSSNLWLKWFLISINSILI